MLKIYDQNHNAIGHIRKYKDLCIESDVKTGDKTMSFTYLARHHEIKNEYYIDDGTDEYVVKEVPSNSDGFPQIVAVLNLEDLEAKPWGSFSVEDSTIDDAARLALAGTGWTVGECTVTKKRNAGMLQVTSKDIIDKLCTAFMCEKVYDTKNKTVSFYDKTGEDKGVYFLRGLNLKKLNKKSDSYDYYTRIIPIGANNLTIESVNDGKNYLENYQYSNKVKTYIWKDESYTNAQALMEDAELKLQDLSKPVVSYSADVIDLANQRGKYSILSYGLGDTVTLIDAGTGIREKQRIVKLKRYPQDHNKDSCEIANTVLTFEEMQQKYQEAAEIINTVVTGDGRYTGTINVSDILNFEQGLSGSGALSGLQGSIDSLNGQLASLSLTVGSIETNYLKADQADLKYATIEQLNATNITVGSIQGDYAEFKSLVTDELTAHSGQIDTISGDLANYKTVIAGELTAAKGWLLEGSIGDAQISSLNANKLQAGTIDTAIVTIAGTDGKMQISDNTIQISDGTVVRVQIGKDGSGDYSLSVWDTSGKLIWDALGATENTIQRKIIRDKMVADDAAIQALKIDFRSFDTALTEQGATISGTVIQVGSKTLDVALSEQSQTIAEHEETLSSHESRITANAQSISLAVTTQEFTTYKGTVDGKIATAKEEAISTAENDATQKADQALEDAKEYTTDQIETVNKSLSTTNQEISVLKGQISLKVEQTDIDSAVAEIDDTIDGLNEKFLLYSTTSQMNAAITAAKDSITSSVSQTYATRTEVSTISGKVSSLETWQAEASQKITKDGIIATVGNYYAKDSDLEETNGRIAEAESAIEQQAGEINLRVKEEDVTGNYIIGKINLSSTTATIEAEHINLSGYVTITDLSTEGQTIINGANIKTGTIAADRIDVAGLFAKDITATGTIRGVSLIGSTISGGTISGTTLTGATGSFSGSVTATSGTFNNVSIQTGTIGGWSIIATRIRTSSSIHMGSKEAGMMLINESSAPFIMAQNASGVSTFQITRDGNVLVRGDITTSNIIVEDRIYMFCSSYGESSSKIPMFYYVNSSQMQAGFGGAYDLYVGDNKITNMIFGKFTQGATGAQSSYTMTVRTNLLGVGNIDCNSIDCSTIFPTGRVEFFSVSNTYWNSIQLRLSGNIGSQGISFVGTNSSGAAIFFNTIADANGHASFAKNLTVNGVTYTKELRCTNYAGTTNQRPCCSYETNGRRVAFIASRGSGSTTLVNFNGQFSDNASSTAYKSLGVNVSSSDIRLKENIRNTETTALPVINRIQIRQFDWKETGAHQEIGFVADELEQINPNFAFGGGYDEDGSMNVKCVNEFYLLGYLTKAVQEISQEMLTITAASPILSRMHDHESRIISIERKERAHTSREEAMQLQLSQAFAKIAELETKINTMQATA